MRKSFIPKKLPSECNFCNVELPIYALLARKPSIISRNKDKVSKQYSAIHFPLKNCDDLSTFSLVAIQHPDTDISEDSIPTERNKTKHKIPITHCGLIFCTDLGLKLTCS